MKACNNSNKRADHTGRNSVLSLKHFEGCFLKFPCYKSLNIHQKIALRTMYTGTQFPTFAVSNLLKFA